MGFLAYDPTYLEHDTGFGHPETSERLNAILSHLETTGHLSRLKRLSPRLARTEEIERAHDSHHVDRVRRATERGASLDPDTPTSAKSYEAALLAAGATLAAADEVMTGDERRGICLVRPPGHHATRDRAMGFCLFNNLAVCAHHLQEQHGVGRIAIVDFDVHHGNGTEDIFGDDPEVFYLSLHRYPFYPGTGGPFPNSRNGVAVRNIPLPFGIPRPEYHEALRVGLSEVERFSPEVLLVSAGFDAHRDDPIGGLGLETEDFGEITGALVKLADRCCEGRVISALEGGYSLATLGPSVEQHLLALDGLA